MGIIVGLYNCDIRALYVSEYLIGNMADISDYRYLLISLGKCVSYRLNCIMAYLKGAYLYVLDTQRLTPSKHPDVFFLYFPYVPLHVLPGLFGRINRRIEFPAKDPYRLNMVYVLMRDEYSVQPVHALSMHGKMFDCSLSGNPCIYDYLCVPASYIMAVATASGR